MLLKKGVIFSDPAKTLIFSLFTAGVSIGMCFYIFRRSLAHYIYFWRGICPQHIVISLKKNSYVCISKFSIFRYVWFWAKDISISHDSYTCRSYPYTKSFPTQRKNEINNFVGAVVGDEWKIWEECPTKCRPKDHLDWTYC